MNAREERSGALARIPGMMSVPVCGIRKTEQEVSLLRQFEVYAYRAAYYLLQQEEAASAAAADALLQSFHDEAFRNGDELSRQQIIKKRVIRSCLNHLREARRARMAE
ncbi:hypothetical protein ACFQ88_00980 [Paenibacillus sp. NPDC056579]|uniref:hypothetical protein n=1 Tax=Paenibacillus sp. NPDC056579 TaxID=3345871 RepID=UPI00369D9905